jgi:hypothetical protein
MAEGETQSAASPTSPQTGNALTHKLGPLPVWAWAAVLVGVVIVYKVIKSRQSASSTASGTVGGANNANSLFGTEGFSVNSAGQVVDNATGDILGGSQNISGGSAGSVSSGAQWFTTAQQTLFNLGYDSSAVDQALQDYAAGNPLPQNEYGIIEAAIRLTGNPPTGIALPELSSTPAPPAAAAAGLPPVNAQSFPLTVLFGQYNPGDYTKIGTITNGAYTGENVSGGVPVYANVFGGFVQDFQSKSLPSGTDIYIPTQFVAYEGNPVVNKPVT